MASSSNNSNYKVVPEATEALNKFKYEVASEVGVKILFKKIKIYLILIMHFQNILEAIFSKLLDLKLKIHY